MCHFRCLWNGMVDYHRSEITVMQFTGHSLPVHQSVTVTRDFNPVPHCQPESPTPIEYALPPSFEWHVWRVKGQYTTTEVICTTNVLELVSSYLFLLTQHFLNSTQQLSSPSVTYWKY